MKGVGAIAVLTFLAFLLVTRIVTTNWKAQANTGV
jgi:hypothetical protein